jgi:PI-3-kinase-related kinase SMG-1
LEAEGLSADPRQRAQWPIETLRRVLADLMEETPKDLVSRELWLGSLNAEQWWSSTLRFSRSCAVMSVIGYVIGLGDRHLDNVLVDLRCGEVGKLQILFLRKIIQYSELFYFSGCSHRLQCLL